MAKTKMPKNVVRIEELQNQKKDQDRRKYQRVLFNNVLNAYTVIEEKGLLQVQLLDISESGIRFQMGQDYGMFHKGEKIAFRLYFSHNDYIPLAVKIVHRQIPKQDDATLVEYGCAIIEVSAEIRACIKDLVHFITRYTEVAKDDRGDHQVYFL